MKARTGFVCAITVALVSGGVAAHAGPAAATGKLAYVASIPGEKNDIYWYSGYRQLDFNPKLFAKPENVKMEELKP